MEAGAKAYPASLEVDYLQKASRLTTFFRQIMIIPVYYFMLLLGRTLTFPLVIIILLRKKYPRWWFDWNLNLTRFSYRVFAYMVLLGQQYPSVDEDQIIHLDLEYPDASHLNRGLPLIKWLLAIPHYIALSVLGIGVFIATFLAWFAILVMGRYPKIFFGFVVGVMRWYLRVDAYALLLITDRYPPFSMHP